MGSLEVELREAAAHLLYHRLVDESDLVLRIESVPKMNM